MNTLFQNILTASFHGSIVILAVMLLRLVLKKNAPEVHLPALAAGGTAAADALPDSKRPELTAQRRPGGAGAAAAQPFPDVRRAGRFFPGRSGRPGAGADA